MNFAELHNHLYGSIPPKLLYEIGKNNPSPRWQIFTESHRQIHGIEIDPKTFFETYKEENFSKLYLMKSGAPFLHFQNKFNLIIALCRFNEEEIGYVSKEISTEDYKKNITHSEYRMMFPPNTPKEVYESKILSVCNGFSETEKKSQGKMSAKLVLSLHRVGEYEKVYRWIKELQNKHEIIKKQLVGIDFCHIEENNPPIEKKDFFKKVNEDNSIDPASALTILYHVGESFTDKGPVSAVRWILESAEYGAHRLGHCLALGIHPENFYGQSAKEKVSELLDQTEFEIKNYEAIKKYNPHLDFSELTKNRDFLKHKFPEDNVEFVMDKNYIDHLEAFQEFGMDYLSKQNIIIEACPTSNLLIGMLNDISHHPVQRFHKAGIKITIGADDPGIFNTDLIREYEITRDNILSEKDVEEIRKKSFEYSSEKMVRK